MQRSGAVSHCFPSVPDGHLSSTNIFKRSRNSESTSCHATLFSYLHAEVVHEQVHARRVVLARMILAHADVYLAVSPGPTFGAHALKPADLVPARGAVQTRIRGTVVDVDLARRSAIPFATVTDKSVVQVDATIRSNRAARVAETLVQFCLALQPDETWSALANESL